MVTLDSNLLFLTILALIVPGYILVSAIRGWSGKRFRPLPDVYSRDNTDFLKGVCATLIMLHHFTCQIKYGSFGLIYSVYIKVGYLAVAVFLLISGYSLMMQFEKKGRDYIDGFLWKRIFRLYIPFAVCTVFVGILQHFSPLRILWNMLTFNFQIESTGAPNATWFVIAILFFSIGFYVSAKWKHGQYMVQGVFLCSALWITLCIIAGVGTWWYNTAWAFPVGGVLCRYRKEVYSWVRNHYWLIVCVLVAISGGTYLIMAIWRSQIILQMVCSTALALFTWVLCLKVDLSGTVGIWLGGFTLELFLVHSAILKAFYGLGITNAGWTILLVLLVSVIAGNWMHHLSEWIIRKVLK